MKPNIFLKKNIELAKLFPDYKFKKNFIVNSVKPLFSAQEKDITFFDSLKYKQDIIKTKANVCITSEKLGKFLPNSIKKIIVKNVLFELARVTKHYTLLPMLIIQTYFLSNRRKINLKMLDLVIMF